MANDHYISRFLTKPWEVGQRRLHFYDFKAGAFGERSSESLFALHGLHSERTGRLLDRLIETPVSNHRAEILRGGMVDVRDNWKLYRALVSLIWLQPQRDGDAHQPGESKFSLDDLLADEEGLVDTLGSMAAEKYQLIGVELPANSFPLFFTEAVYFPIPMAAAKPLLAVPLTPGHFIALPEKGFPERPLRDYLAGLTTLSAFSIGLGGPVNQVLIPPSLLESRDRDPKEFENLLVEQRALCVQIFNTIGEMNQKLGFPSFKVG